MSDTEQNSYPKRRIRSFVRREGRLTPGQQRAIDELWSSFGIDDDGVMLNFEAIFGRTAPITLEIGYGNGESLVQMAKAAPERDFVGIEVHRPGVGRLLHRIEELGLTNLKTICADAVEVLKQQIPDESIDRVQLFFPDPWHKKRHHKRRIVSDEWLMLVRSKLLMGGTIHMATDWEHYAEQMLDDLSSAEGFVNCADESFIPRPESRPLTKFEQRGLDRGHGVWDLLFRRVL
ncbi:MAG: tRNA (guanosine(46)-N7)-methyltransferase TrmB [Gammaproteobacteria bacterium]|nr:tRNA (guanosine(46)-N7)-methyltransferase TrmB [Gammaproteobacteria bacterium]MCW8982743.1 tRNA (guanosine(46)-N7)-methyltransferase TrmB [Gammaproteobacteria bacterium]